MRVQAHRILLGKMADLLVRSDYGNFLWEPVGLVRRVRTDMPGLVTAGVTIF